MTETLDTPARRLLALCGEHGVMLATAESCTGGMVATAVTGIPGSSAGFDRGFVTYSNAAKNEMLGVDLHTLAKFGAVSGETALATAEGALAHSRAGLAVAITGIAGPGGGSAEKPVGLVWFGVALRGGAAVSEKRMFFDGGRQAIREAAARTALELAPAALEAQAAGAL